MLKWWQLLLVFGGVAAGAGALWWYWDRFVSRPARQRGLADSRPQRVEVVRRAAPERGTVPAQPSVIDEPPAIPPVDPLDGPPVIVPELVLPSVPEAAEELVEREDTFSGLYESLYQNAIATPDGASSRWILADWESRLARVEVPALTRAWRGTSQLVTGRLEFGDGSDVDDEAALRLAQAWLQLLTEQWQVRRDDRSEFAFDTVVRRCYDIPGTPTNGARVRVIAPCWSRGDVVMERGVAREEKVATA